MSLLRGIGRSRVGTLAHVCGDALHSISSPLAVRISIALQGLDIDQFETGQRHHLVQISEFLQQHHLSDLKQTRRRPRFVRISTHDDKILCAGIIEHLGIPLGTAAALADLSESGILPLDETLYLCLSQLNSRIDAILAPGSPGSLDLVCRRLFKALQPSGVNGTAVIEAEAGKDGVWTVLSMEEGNIVVQEQDAFPPGDLDIEEPTSEIGEDRIQRLWPKSKPVAALWTVEMAGYVLAFGFADRKSITRALRKSIKEQIDLLTEADTEFIIRSFEKLKANFDRLVESERLSAVTQTAVTVNHEINNPLTAILGNTQLLLMSREKLPKEIVAKLEAIEKSAIQIRETTAKLMSIIEPVKAPYANGLDMIDIRRSKKKDS